MQLVTHAADLSHLGIVKVEGVDACQLLHQQLTQDIKKLSIGEHTYFAVANIKGRLIVNGLMIRLTELSYFLIVEQALTEVLIKHLTKFKLRSKVNLSNLPANITWQCNNTELLNTMNQFKETFSLENSSLKNLDSASNDDALITNIQKHSLLDNLFNTTKAYLQTFLQNNISATNMQIDEAQNQIQLNYLMGTLSIALNTAETTLINEPTNTALQTWHLLHMAHNFTWLTPALSEVYIPQMLGLQTSCVSFSKGCYPGQEVIARSEYRGQVKRQLSWYFTEKSFNLATLNKPMQINQDVLLVDNNADDAVQLNEAVGQIVQIIEVDTQNHLITLVSVCQSITTLEVDCLKVSATV